MSTYSEIIIRVDECVPNVLPERVKLNWLASLDGKLAADVFGMDIREVQALPHKYPEAMDCEPLIGFPYEEIYDHYLTARIHKADGDDDKYQNAMMLYNAALSDFNMWFLNTYEHGHPVPTWFITAYGMAVKQGFAGTVDEWLASLKGEKGDTGKSAYETAVEGGYGGTEQEFYSDLLGRGKTAYQYAVEGGYEGSEEDFRQKMAIEYASLEHDHDAAYAALNHGHDAAYAALDHNHDAAEINQGTLSIDRIPVVPVRKGGTGGETRNDGFTNLAFLGTDPVTVVTDTTSTWIALGNGFAGTTSLCTVKQPSKYGTIISMIVNNFNVHQIFVGTDADLAYRVGSAANGWIFNWRSVLAKTGGEMTGVLTMKDLMVVTKGKNYFETIDDVPEDLPVGTLFYVEMVMEDG